MGHNQGCTYGGASDGAAPDSRVQGAAYLKRENLIFCVQQILN